MALFINASGTFSGHKKLSSPPIKVPGSVKDTLGVRRAYEDGIFEVWGMEGSPVYDTCYIFDDINYINQDDTGKEQVLLQAMKWMKAMDFQYKITIANEQMDMDEFMEEVFSPQNGRQYPQAEDGISKWIQEKVDSGTKDISRTMYLTATCRSRDRDEASIYFGTLEATLQLIFNSMGSRLHRMDGRERLTALQKFYRIGKGAANGGMKYSGPLEGNGWKNHILPASITGHKRYLELDGTYACTMFGHSYATTLDEGKVLHALANVPFPAYVTVDAEPVERKDLMDKLMAAHLNNEKAIAQETDRRNKGGQYGGTSYQKAKRKEELEDYMDQVDDNDEAALFIGLLAVTAADTEEELRRRVDSMQSIAASNGFTLDTYNYRQLKAFGTALPIGGRQVDHMRSFLTSSAVAFNPFYAQDLQDAGGICYGLNRTTKHLIRGNRKLLANPHGIIVSHTGGGKSFLIKETEVAQTLLMTDDDVIILDPQNEFEGIIKDWGGQFFDFTPKCKVYLNPLEVPQHIREGGEVEKDQFIATKTQYLSSFCTAAMTNITVTQEHLAAIGRATRQMYDGVFNKKHIWHQPTLKDFRKCLAAQATASTPEYESRLVTQILNSLEEYTDGVYDMFAHPSNLDINRRLVGFGLKNVPKEIWEPVMITVMQFLADRIQENQGGRVATHLIVDETQVLCAKASSASQLLYAIETYRKFGGIVTMAIQNLSRALDLPELRDMFSNCAYKCFMDQGGVDAAKLREIQDLSAAEYLSLDEDRPGHGIMVWGKKVLLFDAGMAKGNPLYEEFSTNFHEKASRNSGEGGGSL